MGAIGLNDILATPLKRISTEGGDVMHALNKSDKGFNGFGEVYFSWVEQGSIKAWKCHQRMTLNLAVPLSVPYNEKQSVLHPPELPNSRSCVDGISKP
jgi:hypothetical protein